MGAHYVRDAVAVDLEQQQHDRCVVEDFRRRVIRAMGGLRVTTDEAEYTDLVDLDAVLEVIGRTPAVVA